MANKTVIDEKSITAKLLLQDKLNSWISKHCKY